MSRCARRSFSAFGVAFVDPAVARASRDGPSWVATGPSATRGDSGDDRPGAITDGSATPRGPRDRVLTALLGSALLWLAPVVDSHAQSRIGRLFSDPEQRIELDRLRNASDIAGDAAPAINRTEPETRPGSEPRIEPERSRSRRAVTFNGIVVRSDGHRVAWVDGVETAVGAVTPAGVQLDADRAPGGQLRIRLPDGRASAVLKPGQSLDVNGQVHEAYERRSTGDGDETGMPGRSTADAEGGEARPGTAAHPGALEQALPPVLPANLLPELLQAVRAASTSLGGGASALRPAGDDAPTETRAAGRE